MNKQLIIVMAIVALSVLGFVFITNKAKQADETTEKATFESAQRLVLNAEEVVAKQEVMMEKNMMEESLGETAGQAMMEEKKIPPSNLPIEPVLASAKTEIKAETTTQSAGSYLVYDSSLITRAENGRVVLFFRASWCPSCKALDSDIRARASEIPGDVTILNVDYDTHVDLKQKYGVTYQHTLVQVDGKGNLIKKWSGTSKLSDLIAQLK